MRGSIPSSGCFAATFSLWEKVLAPPLHPNVFSAKTILAPVVTSVIAAKT
jgi:hypothetical protein